MKRVSSRGNPWHDERGRFCSRDKAQCMKCGNEYVMVSEMSDEDKQTLNYSMSKDANDTDTQEFYKQQTANRSIYADSLSRYTPRGGAAFSETDTPEERERKRQLQDREKKIALAMFQKENSVAIRDGGTVTMTVNEETGEVSYNIYDAREIVNQATKGYQTKDGRLYKDTSTNMRTGEGYVVTADENDDKVRGCKANATEAEMRASLTGYIEKNKEEQASYHSWEQTVRRIFETNKDNVLLEFTATCDVKNPQIRAEYESKIVYDYPLSKFRADGYSKEIKTLRTDVSIMERALQAIMLSQYRLKVFQDHRLSIKPVVLFKSAKIVDSEAFMSQFIETVSNLTGNELRRISELTDNDTLKEAYSYFEKNGISFDQLAQELRDDFSAEHCISANDDKEAETRQLALNHLEDADNPYRAIFEVKKLDEGWDVLNLFDIVRLYETRQSGGKKISPATVSEAQLIGRGARYCPFQVDSEQEKYKRKYDTDIDNALRICEELYYHCQNDSRYIGELNNALREIGVDIEKVVVREYVLKEEFKADLLYREGLVFTNDRVLKGRNEVTGLLPSVREHVYPVRFATGSSGEDTIFGALEMMEHTVATYTYRTTIGDIAKINYNIVHKAVCKYNVLKFNILRSYFPNLKSTREFIEDDNYMGGIRIEIVSTQEKPSPVILFAACANVVGKIAESVSEIEEIYEGTKEFRPERISSVFKNKRCNYTVVHDGGIGFSQNDSTVPAAWKIDLSQEDWFAFEDNFGTSEEKAFVAYFKSYVPQLKAKYDKVYLLRNERQLHIYSFEGGERFEPDYLLFLHSPKNEGYEQLQVFIEPKGTHLVETDKWKEDFLLEIEGTAIPKKVYVDDNDYKIWGFHFFNQDLRSVEFADDMARVL